MLNGVAKCAIALTSGFLLVSLAANLGKLGGEFELVVQAPYMALFFYGFYASLSKGTSRSGWRKVVLDLLFIFSLMTFFVGYGLHFAANYVEVTMAENELMLFLAPRVVTSWEALFYLSTIYTPTYYFDEILGHQLVYTGFFGLMVGGVLLEAWYRGEEELSIVDHAAIISSSAMLALICSLATAEGQYAVCALVLTLIMAAALIVHFRRSVTKRPFTLLALLTNIMTAACILALATIYFDPISVALHGLAGRVPQPSEPGRILCQFILLSGVFSDEAKIFLCLLL